MYMHTYGYHDINHLRLLYCYIVINTSNHAICRIAHLLCIVYGDIIQASQRVIIPYNFVNTRYSGAILDGSSIKFLRKKH